MPFNTEFFFEDVSIKNIALRTLMNWMVASKGRIIRCFISMRLKTGLIEQTSERTSVKVSPMETVSRVHYIIVGVEC